MIVLIAAINHNNLLGKDNSLPWHVPEDLAHFKAQTIHKAVLMGRKTFESLPGVLNDRTMYVLTNQTDYQPKADHVIIVHSLEDLIKQYTQSDDQLMVAGGASIYEQLMPYADKIILSLIDDDQQGDAYFPEIPSERFALEKTQVNPTFTIKEYQRIR